MPVHPAAPAHELDAILARLSPRVALLPPSASSLDLAVKRLGLAALTVTMPLPGKGSGQGRHPVIDGHPPGLPAADRNALPDDHAIILHTSGTTGRPKLVPITQHNLADHAPRVAPYLPIWPEDVTVIGLPLLHGFAQTVLFRSLAAGGLAVFAGAESDASLPETLIRLLQQHRPAGLPMTPYLLDRLMRLLPADGPIPGGGFRYLQVAGAYLPPALHERAEARFDAPILQCFGASEALAISYQSLFGDRWPETSGEPVVDLRIVDDAGAWLPVGTPGLIEVTGPVVFPGYIDDPAANARVFTADGWFRTGDRAILRPDGHLQLLGRIDDVINRGGSKIDPAEVEAVLLAHPAVAECAVFAIPDPVSGQEPAAAVVLRQNAEATPRALRRWLLDRLSPHKTPRTIVIVGALPRTSTGKVRRAALPSLLDSHGGA